MSTLHETAQLIRGESTAFKASDALVGGVEYTHIHIRAEGKTVAGFALLSILTGKPVAMIECGQGHGIGKLLERIIQGPAAPERRFPKSARAVVRALLIAEDYNSDIYNHIVRVYYRDEFTQAGA